MVKGKTRTGFRYEYDEKILQSMRLLDAIVDTQHQEDSDRVLSGMSDLVTLMLGDKKESLYKHLEKIDPDGIATVEACKNEVTDMMNKAGSEGKN